MSAYTLAFGGLMLLGGRAADILGPRPAGAHRARACSPSPSLVVGLSSSGGLVISGRVGQGVGAALMSPAALSVVVRLFDGEERNKALGIWSSLGGVGAAVGVLLGGVLTAGPGWEWVFFVNVPIGVVLLVGLHRLLPELPAWGGGARLDVVGRHAGDGRDAPGDLRVHRCPRARLGGRYHAGPARRGRGDVRRPRPAGCRAPPRLWSTRGC